MRKLLLGCVLFALLLGPAQAKPDVTFKFGWKVLQQMEEDANLVFSPLSIQSCFAMTALGAHGSTRQEMVDSLELFPSFSLTYGKFLKQLPEGSDSFAVANRVWPSTTTAVRPEFQAECKKIFSADITPLNYQKDAAQARKTINSWVAKITRDKIPELLEPIHIQPSTAMVLTNAVYFKQAWAKPFPAEKTTSQSFHAPGGKVSVPMMEGDIKAGYFENKDLQLVTLPYQDSPFSMALVVPRREDGWKTLRAAFPSNLLEAAAPAEGLVKVYLPKFRFRYALSLVRTMQNLGMKQAFTPQADFSRLSASGGLFISEAVHEGFVSVDEKGTEAAAATAVVVSRSVPRIAHTVRADRPFLFVIYHRPTGAAVFIGQVVNPV